MNKRTKRRIKKLVRNMIEDLIMMIGLLPFALLPFAMIIHWMYFGY